MRFLEKDLEEIIYSARKDTLSERGLSISGTLKRQLRLGNYGVADLVEFERPYFNNYHKRHMKGVITVYELKQEKIGVSTFFQALNYVAGIRHWIEKNKPLLIDSFNYKIVLIGNSFDSSSSFIYLSDIFDNEVQDICTEDEVKTSVRLLKYEYDVDGISFTELTGYKLSNPGF